ncbi:MAG: hypothetical protein OEU32_16290 [Acidimicrobiia bacterium]|nr:hypothetical protein [Acidimicrobiia bacterium]
MDPELAFGGPRAAPLVPAGARELDVEDSISIDGSTAVFTMDLAFRTAVEYVDEAPVCFDDFTMTGSGSELMVDGSQTAGTVEVILDFDGATQCPEPEQDDIGVPQRVDLSGQIDGDTFRGELSFAGIGLPFTASVG